MMVLDRSARVLEMMPHKAGQGEPPNVILRAMSNRPSIIVRLSVAASLARVQRVNAALISFLQMNILVVGGLSLVLMI
jgi:hypothetical protein